MYPDNSMKYPDNSMKPAFKVPEVLKPTLNKLLAAVILAGLLALGGWLKSYGLELRLPAIEAEAKQVQEELKQLKAEVVATRLAITQK